MSNRRRVSLDFVDVDVGHHVSALLTPLCEVAQARLGGAANRLMLILQRKWGRTPLPKG